MYRFLVGVIIAANTFNFLQWLGDFMTAFLDEQNASYDKLAESFLSRKAILAQLLKYAVKEFANCSLKDSEEKYIESDPSLDDTLDIKGKHTESNSLKSGLVTFDTIFDAIAPGDGKPVKIIINIEPQNFTVTTTAALKRFTRFGFVSKPKIIVRTQSKNTI